MENVCKQCATVLTGRRDAQYCSDACRKAHKRNMNQTEPDLTLASPLSLQQQYDELQARHENAVYRISVYTETVNSFINDHELFRFTLEDTYFARVIRRRDSQGEADQLKKHFDMVCKDGKIYTGVSRTLQATFPLDRWPQNHLFSQS